MSALSPVHQLPSYPMTCAIDPRHNVQAETVVCNHAWQIFSNIGQVLSHVAQQIYTFIVSLFVKVGEFFHDLFFKRPSSQGESPRFTPYFEPPRQPPISPNVPPALSSVSSPISSEAAMLHPGQPILINLNGLSRAPRAISQEEIEQDLRAASTQITNLNELVALCRTFSPEHEALIMHFIAFANNGGNVEYFLTLRSYFKGIIVEMRKDSIPAELKQQSFEKLANGYYGCNAIRFNSAEREYKRLTNRLPTAEDMILETLQQFKERIFIDHYHLQHNPSYLNHIRREVGTDLGLDRHPFHINDPQIENGLRGTRDEYLNVFRNELTHDVIINRMRYLLNELFLNSDHGRDLDQYVKTRLSQLEARREISQQQKVALKEEYIPWGYQISESGTKFLLLQIGVFAHG